MKTRILCILLAVASLVTCALADGSRAARMNYQTGMTISANGVDAIVDTCQRQPGMRMLMEQALGLGFEGNLELLGKSTFPAGTEFINSGLDKRGIPFQWKQKSNGALICWQVRNKATNKVALIKDNCLNPVNRIAAVPLVNQTVVETSNSTEVDMDVSLAVTIDFKPNVVATATASTAPIIINNNISMPSAPLMMAGGGANPNFYTIVRDARGFLQVGQTFGGGTKINICNTNVNSNSNTNNNNNNNSNSNSNSNTNVINLGRPGG